MVKSISIREFLATLDYLMVSLSSAQDGNTEEISVCFPYVKQRLEGAKKGLEKLGLFPAATELVRSLEVLSNQGDYKVADEQLLQFARMLAEVSGENDRLRRLYGGHQTPSSIQ